MSFARHRASIGLRRYVVSSWSSICIARRWPLISWGMSSTIVADHGGSQTAVPFGRTTRSSSTRCWPSVTVSTLATTSLCAGSAKRNRPKVAVPSRGRYRRAVFRSVDGFAASEAERRKAQALGGRAQPSGGRASAAEQLQRRGAHAGGWAGSLAAVSGPCWSPASPKYRPRPADVRSVQTSGRHSPDRRGGDTVRDRCSRGVPRTGDSDESARWST